MKTSAFTIAILALSLSACARKEITEENPAGMSPLREKAESIIPAEFKGDWERCQIDELKGKSIYTKVILNENLVIRETTFNDLHCQMIDSTKERTVISLYKVEMDGLAIRAKIQSRKLNLFRSTEVDQFNATNQCGISDWRIKIPNEILGVPCSDLPRDNRHDLSFFSMARSKNKLIFAEQEMKRVPEAKEVVASTVKLFNPTSSEVLPEPGSKNVMLVYPPKTESVVIEVNPAGPNLNHCDAVLNTYKTSKNSSVKITSLKSDVETLKQRIELIKAEVSKSISDMMDFVQANGLQDYDALVKQFDEIQEQISAMESDYKACDDNCDEIWAKLVQLRNNRKDINNKFADVGITRSLSKGYYAHVAKIDRTERSIAYQAELLIEKQQQVREAEDKLLKLFDDLAEIEGSSGKVKFVSGWSQNLTTLLKANPQYKFRLADVSKIVLSYKMLKVGNYPGSGSILRLPLKNTRVLVNHRFGMDAYPMAINGPVKLSLLASCPARNPEAFGLKLIKPNILEYELNFSFRP